MKRALTYVFVFIALMSGSRVLAQGDTDCLTTLSHAESEFAAGRFFGIPSLLDECIKSNRFSNEEKVRVYLLLSQVYLLTDNPTAADEAYLKVLGANPEFVPSDLDPIDVVYLSKKFTSRPIFTPHVKLGGNMSAASTIYTQNVVSTPDSTVVSRKALPGWTIGGGVEWNINDNLGIGVEGFLSQKRFRTNVDRLFKNDNSTMIESQLWVDIPFYVRYGWHQGNIRPFVYAGGSINLLLLANTENTYNDHTIIVDSEDPAKSTDRVTPYAAPSRNITYKRNFFNRSLVFGAGTLIKIGKDFISVDVRYMPGLSNVSNIKYNNYSSKDRNELDPWTTQFAAIGDVFRVNNMALMVGYVRPLYNPRRVAHANTKSVSRKLMKREKNEK